MDPLEIRENKVFETLRKLNKLDFVIVQGWVTRCL